MTKTQPPPPYDQLSPGWVLLAFTTELQADVTPASAAGRPLVVVRQDGRVRVADATCPHRGAHLGFGGELVGDWVVRCPFHGRSVAVGEGRRAGHQVAEHPVREIGGAIFALLDPDQERGLGETLDRLDQTHVVSPGFVLGARVAAPYVVENVFDGEHFETVHKVVGAPRMAVNRGEHGELLVAGKLHNRRANDWQAARDDGGLVSTRFLAHVFSPTLVMSELGAADRPYLVFTGATPVPGGCMIRVAVAIPRTPRQDGPDEELVAGLVRDSRTAFEQDLVVWEHLVPGAPQHLDERDEAVAEFHRFCAEFAKAGVFVP